MPCSQLHPIPNMRGGGWGGSEDDTLALFTLMYNVGDDCRTLGWRWRKGNIFPSVSPPPASETFLGLFPGASAPSYGITALYWVAGAGSGSCPILPAGRQWQHLKFWAEVKDHHYVLSFQGHSPWRRHQGPARIPPVTDLTSSQGSPSLLLAALTFRDFWQICG